MSLYNQLFNENPDAAVLIGVLGLNKEVFGRYRDIYLNTDGTEITVYTRCGGGNRTEYERVFEMMKRHPNYISDWDDSFDNTYAYIKFSVPEKYADMCKKIAPKKEPLNVHEKFEQETKAMDNDDPEAMKRAMDIFGPIMAAIEKDLRDNPPDDDEGPTIRFLKI